MYVTSCSQCWIWRNSLAVFLSFQTNSADDKIVCILTRAQCTDEEWKEYEDKVESEIDLEDLLEDLGKVLEAAKRLSMK